MDETRCIICNLPTKEKTLTYPDDQTGGEIYKTNCYRCGVFHIHEQASVSLTSYINSAIKRSNLSGYIYNSINKKINYSDLKDLEKLEKPSVGERSEKLFLYFSKNFPNIGTIIRINFADNQLRAISNNPTDFNPKIAELYLPMYSASWSDDYKQLHYLFTNYLRNQKKFITTRDDPNMAEISPKGWEYLDSLKIKNPESSIAFIAMKFDSDLLAFNKKYVFKILDDLGYKPERMDMHEHNNIIDDQMVALIKQSRFVIADLTGNSAGAYFEAGFAHGFGLDVIYICEKKYYEENVKAIHFDTNHRPIIFYDKDNGEELMDKLSNRIKATIE